MPSVSSGMNEVCEPALLADSGAATPRMLPLPNGTSPGFSLVFFSMVYAAKADSMAPPPGRMPSAEPSMVPRRMAGIISFQSSLVG